MKPRIMRRPSGVILGLYMTYYWICEGSGERAAGLDAMDAYCKWRLKVKPLMVEE